MLQIGSYCDNYLIINVIFKRLSVKAGINSLPFAIFVTQNKEKMNLRERFGTLCSRLGVEFQCPYCHSNNIIKSGKSSTGKQRSDANIAGSVLLPTTHTKPIFLTLIPKSLN